jgi:hypothetical protein
MKLLGIANVDFDVILVCLRLVRSSISLICWRRSGSVMAQCITCSDFKKGYVSVRTEVLYNLLIEYGMPRNIDGLIKMCLNETYSTVLIGKICPTVFLLRTS